jgi:hypothetical protein
MRNTGLGEGSGERSGARRPAIACPSTDRAEGCLPPALRELPGDADGMNVGPWDANRVLAGVAMMPLGALALIAAGWISLGMGAASRELARWGTR